MKLKSRLITKSSLIFLSSIGVFACNSGSHANSGVNPKPNNLPNVFDPDSVQNLRVEALSLNGNKLANIDLTKVGGHSTYKLRLSNPNLFTLNVSKLSFSNLNGKEIVPNYYFSRNNQADNCFNQTWFKIKNAVSEMEIPAMSGCSFYVTSFWQGPNQGSGTDMLDYVVTNPGFGFEISQGKEINAWCESGCYPKGENKIVANIRNNDSINYKASTLKYSSNPIINAVPVTGIALGGDFLFSNGEAALRTLTFNKYQVKFDNNELRVIESKPIVYNLSVNVVPSYFGFKTQKDGKYITYTIDIPGYRLVTAFQGTTNSTYAYGTITSSEPTSGVQGLDDRVYYNSSDYKLYYQTYAVNYPVAPLNKLSVNLPFNNSIILGVDADGNMVIKTGSSISCHIKQADYLGLPNLGSFSSMADNLISNNNLYTNHVTNGNKYYDVNGVLLDTDSLLFYRVDVPLCHAITGLESANQSSFLVVPRKQIMVITNKYTAIKTESGYAFAALDNTSDGHNNLERQK